MGPGGIATIIAAASLFVIACAVAYAVVRLGRFISKNVENVTTKVSEATTDFIDHSGPAVQVASALLTAAQAGKNRSKKKKKAE
jgi:uncharacterized membrane protein YedE/YeeE